MRPSFMFSVLSSAIVALATIASDVPVAEAAHSASCINACSNYARAACGGGSSSSSICFDVFYAGCLADCVPDCSSS